jgi:hypothetical protein
VDTVHTKKHQKAPEQGKHVPEVGLEPGSSPCKSASPPKTSTIRPSPAPVRPDPKPRVCTMCTPSSCTLRRPQPGCINGHPSRTVLSCARFHSDMKSRPPEPDRPRTSTAPGGGPHAGIRRTSWRRSPPFRTSHGGENRNLHDQPTGGPPSVAEVYLAMTEFTYPRCGSDGSRPETPRQVAYPFEWSSETLPRCALAGRNTTAISLRP